MATSASVTSSSRGSRANVAGPANRGTTLASTGPTRPSVLTRGGLSLIRWLSSGGREGVLPRWSGGRVLRRPGGAVGLLLVRAVGPAARSRARTRATAGPAPTAPPGTAAG